MRKLLLFGIFWLIGCLSSLMASEIDDSLKNDSNNSAKIYIVGNLEVSNFESITSQKKIQVIRIPTPKEEIVKKDLEKDNKGIKNIPAKPTPKLNSSQKTKVVPRFKIAKSPTSDTEWSVFSTGKAKALRENFPEILKIKSFHLFQSNFPVYCIISEKKKFKFEFLSGNIDLSITHANRPRPSPGLSII